VLGLDAVDRRQRAAEHVVEAPIFVRPLERDEVGRLLHDADERAIPPLVATDLAALLLGQIPAFGAEADAVLHVADRVRERLCFVLRDTQEVEGEAVRRSRADSGQSRQLRDEVLDGRGEHGRIVPG
jgi:hypothetical protein